MKAPHPNTPSILSLGESSPPVLIDGRVSDPEWQLPQDARGAGCTRLVVLVPDEEIDTSKLLRELADLAVPPVVEILFVGLGHGLSLNGLYQRLNLLVSEARTHTTTVIRKQVVESSSWIKAAQIVARPGDLFVCHIEQRAGRVGQELEEITPFPVHLLSNLRLTVAVRVQRAVTRLVFELLPLVISVSFFWLQAQIDNQLSGLISTLVIILTVLAEIGLVFVWSLFSPR